MDDTPELTEAQVAELRGLAEAATPGRWHIYGGHNDYAIYSAQEGDAVAHVMNLDAYKMKPSLADAEFIAAAHPQAILALLADRTRLQAEVARVALSNRERQWLQLALGTLANQRSSILLEGEIVTNPWVELNALWRKLSTLPVATEVTNG